MNQKIQEKLKKTNGDIFEFFISLYDFMDERCSQKQEMNFYKEIFENIKTSQDFLIPKEIIKEFPDKIKEFMEKIDTTNLRVKTKDDIDTIQKILFAITNKAIVTRFKYKSKEEARANYLKQLEFLKHGILK